MDRFHNDWQGDWGMAGDTTGIDTPQLEGGESAQVIQAGDFGGKIEIASADLLFQGNYSRLGDDLFLTDSHGSNVLVTDYFLSETPATLVSGSGAVMPGDLVTTLAGPRAPGQYAQAGATNTGAIKIGVVEKLTGDATATRADGSSVKLKVGDAVFKGDVVATGTGSALGITFKDGTVFNMTASARMVLNNLVYEDGGKENAMLFSLVQGGFSFVAGKVAPTGDMKIDTPVATMGIRGTTPFVLIADNGKTTFSILPDPDGKVGIYSLFNRESGALIGTVSDTGTKFELTSATSAPLELTKTAAELLEDSQTQKQLVDVFNRAQQNPFNEGAQSDQGQGEGEQKDQKEGDGEQKPGDEGSNEQGDGVSGSGITTEVAGDSSGEQTPKLGQGAGGNLNVEAGSETDSGGEIALGSTSGDTGSDETPLTPDDPVVDNPALEPIVTLPASASVTEDGSTIISGISITDDSANIGVTLSAQSTITLASVAGLTFSAGDGIDDENMAFTGSPEDVTAALDGLTYNPTGDNDVGGGVTITVTDGTNVVVSQLDVDITPVNDQPVVTVTDPAPHNEGNAGAGSPDVTVDLFAQTTIVDPDTLDQQSYEAGSASVAVGAGSPASVNTGQVTLNAATGLLTYNPDNFDFLNAGEAASFDVTFDVRSGPDVVTRTLNVQINGVNDLPVSADNAINADASNQHSFVLGDFAFTDADAGAALDHVTIISLPGAGDLTLSGNAVTTGQQIAAADIPNLQYQHNFGSGGVNSSTFQFSVSDGAGDSAAFDMTINAAANIPPTVTSNNPAPVPEGDAGGSSPVVNVDVFAQTDIVDPDNSPGEQSYVANTADFIVASGSAPGVTTALASIDDVNGIFSYNPDDFDFLTAGQSAIFEVLYSVASGPDTSAQSIFVEITGQNDAPTVTVTNPAASSEQGAGPSSEVLIDLFSTLTISDPDQGEAAGASYVNNSATVSVASGSALGVLATQIGVDATGTVSFFDGTFNFLKAGEKALFDVSFDVQVGPDTVTRTAQIEITGQNDAPTVTVNNPAPVTEGNAGGTATQILFNVFDRLVISDPDDGEAAGAAYVANSATVSVGAGSAAGVNTMQVSLDPVTGEFSYFDDTFDFLGAGEFAFFNIDFDATVGADTVSRTVQVQINGENDLPVVSAVTNPAAVPEGDTGVLSIHSFNLLATVTASDVDGTDTPTVDETSVAIAVNPSSDTADFLSLAINGAGNTTRIDVDTANFDFLKNGEQAIFDVTFDVISGVDTVTRTATITITGANDAPELDLDLNNSSGATGADYNDTFVEGAGPVRIGDLAESDLNITDFDDTSFESVTATLTNRPDGGAESLSFVGSLPSGVTLTAYNPTTGVITLTGTATKAQYEGLIENIVYDNTSDDPDLTDRIIEVVVNDGDDDSNIATATISMVATNDPPIVTANNPAAVFEGNAGDSPTTNTVILLDQVTIVDPDSADTQSYVSGTASITVNAASAAGVLLSQVTLNSTTGEVSYDPATFDFLDTSESAIFTVTFDVQSGPDTVTRSIDIEIKGLNDTPSAADNTLTIDEDTSHTFASGEFGFSDPDASDNFVGIKVTSLPTGGTLRLSGVAVTTGQIIAFAVLGNLVYTPAVNANGAAADSFQFEVFDGSVYSTPKTITFDITPVADSPTAVTDHFEGTSGDVLTGNIFANDLNPDGPPDLTTQAAVFFTEKGNKVEVSATGDVTFTPFGNFEGADNFNYLITDGQGDQDTGVASFVINPTVNGDQTLPGTTGNDQLIGASGADTLTGLGGNDILVGGGTSIDPRNLLTDIDLLDGGAGNDRLYATESRANLIGGQGDDVLAGAPNKGGLGTDFYTADYSSSTGAIKANFTPISQTVAGTLLNPNEVSDGTGGTDWVSGISYVRDTNQDDTLLIDNGLDDRPTKVYLSGGNDTVTFSNFAANPESQISYQFATSIDGIVGVNADLQSSSATGITSANVDAANPFITTASAPASNNSIGNDSFTGAFELAGSGFNDQLFGDANDNFLFGNGGDDYIDGRGGSNTAGYFFASAGVNVDLSIDMAIADGDGGQDQLVNISKIVGSLHDDTIVGDTQVNEFVGLSGDDHISGGAGDDIINGGGFGNPDYFDGNDTLNGDAGLDTIFGGTGDDDIFGGDDNDFLDGGKGNDLIDGGAGNDQILTGGSPLDTYSNFFGRGDIVYGGTGNDQIFSQGGFALIDGGQGNDTITDTGTGANKDWANVTYKSSPAAIQANLSSTARTVGGTALGAFEVADGFGTVDNVQRMHVIRDSAFDDTIFVDETYDNSFSEVGFRFLEVRLSGGDDNVTFQNFGTSTGARISYQNSGSIDGIIGVNADLATGTATGLTQGLIDANNTLFTTSVTTNTTVGTDTFSGANMLRGSKFNDQLFGSNAANEERLRGSQGDDFIDGRGGIDTVDYGNSSSGVTVDLLNGVTTDDGFGDQDQLLNIENIRGSLFNDSLTGDNNANQIRGNSGDDLISGGGGSDTLRGDEGSDVLSGNGGNDILIGGGAPDDINAGGDLLYGGGGNDSLTSANGFSVLQGGAGNDTLTVINPGSVLWNDFSIADYSTSSGNVKANLTSTAQTIDGSFLNSFEIEDGLGGRDTMTIGQGTNVLRDGSGNDTIIVDATYTNNYGNWIEVRLSAGDDMVDFQGVSAARISYRNAASADGITGVHIDAASGMATGLTAGLIDPSNTLFTSSLSVNTSVGNDTLFGANRYRGSEFNDQIIGSGANERFRGDGGNDFINGGGGTDRLTFGSSVSGINVDLAAGTVSDDGRGGTDQVLNIEDVRGSVFDDTIIGDSGNNRFWGTAGDDTLIGLAGNDELHGDDSNPNNDGGFGGNDVLEGGDGNDALEGGVGDDILRGGDQNDFLIGGEGDDFIDGGDDFLLGGYGVRGSFDHVSYADSPAGVTVDLQHGYALDGFGTADVLVGIEVVTGSAHDDTLLGGNPNNDGFEDFRPGDGTDTIDGGSGFDRLRYFDAPAGIVANLSNTTQFGAAAGTVLDGFGNTDTASNIESVQGSAFNDILIGDDNGFQFRGRQGNDQLIGGAGVDEADYAFSNGTQGIVANLNNSTDQVTDTFGDIDQLTSIENIRGSFMGDSIIGDNNDNKFVGLSGNDNIDGFGGHDIIDYNREFNNVLDNFSYGNGPAPGGVNVDLGSATATDTVGDTDTLAGIEEVIGTILDDTITGDLLDNIIESRSGADTLTGGGGADRFTTIAGDTGVDTITDFNPLDDKLDISKLLDASFSPATSGDFVKAVDNSGDTTVSVDADGTANGVNFVDIATLQGVGIGSTLTYVYDDADNTTTVTVV